MLEPTIWHAPATELAIAEAKERLHKLGPVSDQLCVQWRKWNGFETQTAEFYSTDDIAERNSTLETSKFCDGYLVIANDSGSRVAMLDLRGGSKNVFLNYMGSMNASSMENTQMSLETWIANDCPFELDFYLEVSAVEPVMLRLDTMPNGGLKAMLRIKKITQLDMGISDLKNLQEKLPITLCYTSYIKALRLASEINKSYSCVSIWKESDSTESLPLENPFE